MLRSKRLSGFLLCAILSMVTNGCARGYISEESISKIRSIMPAFDVTNESWEFAPSRNPGELRKMCIRDVGCVYE